MVTVWLCWSVYSSTSCGRDAPQWSGGLSTVSTFHLVSWVCCGWWCAEITFLFGQSLVNSFKIYLKRKEGNVVFWPICSDVDESGRNGASEWTRPENMLVVGKKGKEKGTCSKSQPSKLPHYRGIHIVNFFFPFFLLNFVRLVYIQKPHNNTHSYTYTHAFFVLSYAVHVFLNVNSCG